MDSRTRLSRVTNMLALLACCAAAGVAHAAEQAYPARPIRLIVPYAPGGGTDTLARIFSQKLSEAMVQTWVVDNRTGAGGNLAVEIVVRANADGHTVLLALDSLLTANPSLLKVSYNIEKDLQPITMLAFANMIVIVHASVPARTLQEFVAYVKQNPGKLNYGSGGVGSPIHLAAELLKKRTGIDMVHIPYKGGGPAAAALLAGECQVQIGTVPATIGHIKAGRLRALATTGTKRSKLLPELPTVAESGYPGFETSLWYALLVPAATPKGIVARIRDEALKTLQQADVQAALERQGMDPLSSTPAELAARIKRESIIWAGVIKDAGIRGE